MSVLFALLGFIAAISLLVFIHEYGHYKVALLCGVKVKRFSIGFGKAIFSRTDKNGVEWVIGWAPLGGYVLMLDGRNEPIPPGEEARAFDNASVWRRIAIVIAGPMANLIFALAAWTIVFSMDTEAPRAYMGAPIPETHAAKAGFKGQDLLLSVQGSPVASLEDAALLLVEAAVDRDASVPMTVDRDGKTIELTANFSDFDAGSAGDDFLGALGWSSPGPQRPAKVARVLQGSPAERAGLKKGDQVMSIDGAPIKTFGDMAAIVALSPGKPLSMSVADASGATRVISVTPESSSKLGYRAKIGVGFDSAMSPQERAKYVTQVERGFFEAIGKSGERAYAISKMSLQAIWAMITGKSGSDGLSGPVGIAQQAGDSVSAGVVPFISFLAILSLSLFLMNMLPIPALDGGHLTLFAIEAVTGKPVPEAAQQGFAKVGFVMLLGLMFFAVFNDLSKIFS